MIPKRFTLANREWRVQWKALGKGTLGETDFVRARIYLSPSIKCDRALAEHTFMHELLHASTNAIGWQALNGDEDRIDALAGMLVQALRTAS